MADETTPGEVAPAEESKYDQAFFLALAAKGKEAWNAWRRDPANGRERATFAGVDFSKAPWDEIDFSGFEFGHWVDFSGYVWRGVPWQFGGDWELGYGFGIRFDPKAFRPGRASFIGATFGPSAYFIDAIFGEEAFFDEATFDGHPNFSGAAFGDRASLTRTTFESWTRFDNATFGAAANFDGATFGHYTAFFGAAFGYGATFDGAVFAGSVSFIAGRDPTERKEDPENLLKQRHRQLWEHRGSGPDRFRRISFTKARFHEEADFSGRTLEDVLNFTNARFFYPPSFHNVTNVTQIDFSGVHIGFVPPGNRLHWTKNSIIPVRLRALRKIAEETKNHDLERDLYIEERNAERGVYWRLRWEALKKEGWKNWPRHAARLATHGLWIFIMFLYGALGDYGRSFARPFFFLIASGLFFYWCYGKILAPLAPIIGPLVGRYDHAIRMLALGNAVPFIGPLSIDADIKKFLFCPSGNCSGPIIPPEGYQLLVLGQNLVSIILVFFIGLALRNYFKIK